MGELLDRVDSRELTEWEAYERVAGPIGQERLDELFAMLMTIIANVNRSKKQRAYETRQFRPKWDPEAPPERRPEMSGHQILDQVRKLNRRMGGRGGDAARPSDQDRD